MPAGFSLETVSICCTRTTPTASWVVSIFLLFIMTPPLLISTWVLSWDVKTSLCLCGAEEPAVIPQKKTRRANTSTFSFQQHCIFCGKDYNLERDPKNPARRKPACYGQKFDTMSNARLTAWAAKTGKEQVSTPTLCSLPPTTEAFVENVKRAHHQATIWRSAK